MVARKLSGLKARVVSGAVMAALALGTAWLGGAAFFLFWLAAAVIVFLEWRKLTRRNPVCTFAGLAYAAAAFIAPVLIRMDAELGFAAVLWLFAVVWGTDIMAYFTGRLVGGPKLWPAVSPNKTWSGFAGGTLFGAAAATGVAAFFNAPALLPVAVLGFIAAVISQGGDLFESSLKRRFGVKDSGTLIPGHGGLMDRLDGFIPAALFVLLIGLARGGMEAVGRGVLLW